MIRFNLLRNRFQSSSLAAEPETLGSLSTLSMRTVGGSSVGKKLAIAAGIVVVLGAIGGGTWWFLNQSPADEIAPPTQTAKPVPPPQPPPQPAQPAQPSQPTTDTVKKSPAELAKLAKDSARKADSAKVAAAAAHKADSVKAAKEAARKADSVKSALAKKPEPPKPETKVAEPLPPPPPPSVVPRVVAPALAGGVVAQVIAESQANGAKAPAPNRFEDLSPLARLAYQQFAFERILAVIRQVAPPGVKFTRIRLYSPGLVVIQGTSSEAEGVNTLVKGLLAQSLVDTTLKAGAGGQFALAARLPFSSGSVRNGKPGKDFQSTIVQARDLAQTGGLTLSAPKAPSTQTFGTLKRANWKLSGAGPWESIGKWFGALQSMELPVGFTSATLSAGTDGALKLEAEAISYAP